MGVRENEKIVREISERYKKANSLCFTGFLRLGAAQISELRQSLKRENAELKVFKNTLVKKALSVEAGVDNIDKMLDGPTALVFGYKDPIQPLKIISDFRGENEGLVVRGGFIEGGYFDYETFKKLTTIPPKDELYRKILVSLKSPLNKLTFILSGVTRKFMVVLSEIAKQKKEE
jgi:large subunit ribosomal protein L10